MEDERRIRAAGAVADDLGDDIEKDGAREECTYPGEDEDVGGLFLESRWQQAKRGREETHIGEVWEDAGSTGYC